MHLITTFVSTGQKTATTLCGKKVAVGKIALDCDATCPVCREWVEQERVGVIGVLHHIETTGLYAQQPDKLAELKALASAPISYRSIRFL